MDIHLVLCSADEQTGVCSAWLRKTAAETTACELNEKESASTREWAKAHGHDYLDGDAFSDFYVHTLRVEDSP